MSDKHKPLNIPKDRSAIVEKAMLADDGSCSTAGPSLLSNEPCPTCRYLAWVISAETGNTLGCAVCDARSQARDFKTERDEHREQIQELVAASWDLMIELNGGGFIVSDQDQSAWASLTRRYVATVDKMPKAKGGAA